jgi:hypothetical protein
MKLTIDIADYSPESGIRLSWLPSARIDVQIDKEAIIISGNNKGLLSLANHLLTLSQKSIPSGHHIHLDESNGLEDKSRELILLKI